MKHIWSIICQRSSIDFETNSLSLFDCVEEVSAVVDKTKLAQNDKIIIPVEFQLVSFWAVKDSEKDNDLKIKGEFVDSKNKILNSFENSFNIKKGIKRFRNRTNIKGLPITEDGRYYLKVWQWTENKNKFEMVAELPLDVKLSYQLLPNNRK
ncbi:MAG: hypothetical protein ABIH67_04570 [Candidatus Uhrbacteria bacterium]